MKTKLLVVEGIKTALKPPSCIITLLSAVHQRVGHEGGSLGYNLPLNAEANKTVGYYCD